MPEGNPGNPTEAPSKKFNIEDLVLRNKGAAAEREHLYRLIASRYKIPREKIFSHLPGNKNLVDERMLLKVFILTKEKFSAARIVDALARTGSGEISTSSIIQARQRYFPGRMRFKGGGEDASSKKVAWPPERLSKVAKEMVQERSVLEISRSLRVTKNEIHGAVWREGIAALKRHENDENWQKFQSLHTPRTAFLVEHGGVSFPEAVKIVRSATWKARSKAIRIPGKDKKK